ncbi:MAG: cysteine desulfurase family protein, partial [Actinomycetota bacterium]
VLTSNFGNPSSVYAAGRNARKAIEDAREQLADVIGAQPSEIVFTAGGTEADNLALKGTAMRSGRNSGHIITAAAEHHAVLHSAEWLASRGFEVTIIPVRPDGIVDLERLADALRPETLVVSVMTVNNEVGTIQPIEEIVALVKEKSRALVHTDAVQALGKIPVDVRLSGVDMAAFSAHKLGGPKGTGALYVRRRTPLEALLHGGGQERDMRSGTPNVAGIAGFGKAAQIASAELPQEGLRLAAMRDRLQSEISVRIPGAQVIGGEAPRIPGTLNICFGGLEGESLLLMLDQQSIAASSGSACTSGSLDPSHVLAAMGVPRTFALGALRMSLGRGSTDGDVDHLLAVLPGIVDRLREKAGGRRPARAAG